MLVLVLLVLVLFVTLIGITIISIISLIVLHVLLAVRHVLRLRQGGRPPTDGPVAHRVRERGSAPKRGRLYDLFSHHMHLCSGSLMV